ncbi:MAG TPA: type I-C CRISPR-associated protein Cas8c/Csd1 [Dokdonella sp.]|uniref:type I-C CRISPR-associated protein Cas8c/Csd1 n=1 Tax=Dokdonella sp. TaxID=2291710 RepID=UPI002D7F364D|nr:type I-C CRISPR-associated protein Cas8c/Csd1 [Dokdonella sp.]HET9033417.1 type I-C CRISPR-associated protein Cas8c/Csd1 [Dokdonella sp.]
MILQALNEYYVRKSASGELPPPGFSTKAIPFLVVLSPNGIFVQLADTRELVGKRFVAKTFLVPEEKERSGPRAYETANLLWDHYGYALNFPKSDRQQDVEMAHKQFTAFRKCVDQALHSLPEEIGLQAVAAFLDSDEQIQRVRADLRWDECSRIPGCNISFRLDGDVELVCQRPRIAELVAEGTDLGPQDDEFDGAASTVHAFCAVTGEIDQIARLHRRTPITNSKSNAKLVSFQKNSGYDSYGKEQSFNAPVGEKAAFAYTTALNHLLRKGSSQRMQIGDASTVFWAADANKSPFESDFAAVFGETEMDGPDRGVEAVRNLYRATATGAYAGDDRDSRFFVLGLAPNAARIAVRFWQSSTIAELALRIRQHFDDLELVKPDFESPYLSLYRLFTSIALLNKVENIPPDMAGDTMRAILLGSPYPSTLMQAAIRRIRADQTIKYPRAAVLKASLNRLIRHNRLSAKELTVSLDPENTDPAYRLGRLFAALERIQAIAQPGINATIRERYFGAASSSPSSVFPILLKLKNHHLAKIDKPGLVVWFEKLLGQIFAGLNAIPTRLSLTEQGLFAVGYYHQQQDFYTSKQKPDDVASQPEDQGETA